MRKLVFLSLVIAVICVAATSSADDHPSAGTTKTGPALAIGGFVGTGAAYAARLALFPKELGSSEGWLLSEEQSELAGYLPGLGGLLHGMGAIAGRMDLVRTEGSVGDGLAMLALGLVEMAGFTVGVYGIAKTVFESRPKEPAKSHWGFAPASLSGSPGIVASGTW